MCISHVLLAIYRLSEPALEEGRPGEGACKGRAIQRGNGMLCHAYEMVWYVIQRGNGMVCYPPRKWCLSAIHAQSNAQSNAQSSVQGTPDRKLNVQVLSVG